MTTAKNEAPRLRSMELEVEVPGTPEQVWQAIATGPGITAWLAPTEVEEREGGAVTFHMGPNMDSAGVVTAWEPSRRFAYEERDWMPGAPPLATEVLVEARAGGTCRVRLVSSLFTSSDEWDDQIKGFEKGWTPFLDLLRRYLGLFPGQPCSPVRVMANAPGPEEQAWTVLAGSLGLSGAVVGERRASSAPPLAGIVERVAEREITLRTEQPAPGFALIGTYSWGGQVHSSVNLYLFGDQAPAAAAREEPAWRAWMEERFPREGPR